MSKHYTLRGNADTSHETARDWYEAYGCSIIIDGSYDDSYAVEVTAIEYDWLDDGDDDAVLARYLGDDEVTDDERDQLMSVVEKAREVRETAESICSLLDDAVSAYASRDLAACIQALDDAEREESEHGASPASDGLREQLLEEMIADAAPEQYVVVYAREGSPEEFIGVAATLEEARALADDPTPGTPARLYETAREARCDVPGCSAPPDWYDRDAPAYEWAGEDGYYAIVRRSDCERGAREDRGDGARLRAKFLGEAEEVL